MNLTNLQKLIILLAAIALLVAVVVICIANGQGALPGPTRPDPTGNLTDPVDTDPVNTDPSDPSQPIPTSDNVGIWPEDIQPGGSDDPTDPTNAADPTDPTDASEPDASIGVGVWDETEPDETEPSQPQATEPPATEPPATQPKPTEPAPTTPEAGTELTWEEYKALTPPQQQAYFETFAGHTEFFAWYNKAKAEYDASTEPIPTIDGEINIGDLINGGNG